MNKLKIYLADVWPSYNQALLIRGNVTIRFDVNINVDTAYWAQQALNIYVSSENNFMR